MTRSELGQFFNEKGVPVDGVAIHRRMKVTKRRQIVINRNRISGATSATAYREGSAKIQFFRAGLVVYSKHIQGITVREFDAEVDRLTYIVRENRHSYAET